MPELEHYSDDTELANYSDDLADGDDGDMEPAIHLVDKLPVYYYLDGFVAVVVVPNNWHNYCTLEIDLIHNNSYDYDCSENVDVIVK